MRFKSNEDKLTAMTIIENTNQIEEVKPTPAKKNN